MPQADKIMVIAGETSGDLHGARLIEQLRQLNPGVDISGMGCDRMRVAGIDFLLDASSISVMGLVEVVRHWPAIRKALDTMAEAIEDTKPDVLVLIDYVEFNLRMAEVAQRALRKYVLNPLGRQLED